MKNRLFVLVAATFFAACLGVGAACAGSGKSQQSSFQSQSESSQSAQDSQGGSFEDSTAFFSENSQNSDESSSTSSTTESQSSSTESGSSSYDSSTSSSDNSRETFTITFQANGGAFSDGAAFLSTECESGGTLSAPVDPARDGYTFDGWYAEESLINLWNFEETVQESFTLYAGWSAVITERNVTFVLNYNGETVVKSTENGLVTYVPQRGGYDFCGWWYYGGQTDAGCILTTRFDALQVVDEDNLVLYAEWSPTAAPSQLATPCVNAEGDTFTWSAIDGAEGYTVEVCNSTGSVLYETAVSGCEYTFPSSFGAGYYIVKVRAAGDGETTVSSSYAVKYYAYRALPLVTGIEINASSSLVTWNAVNGAEGYEIYIGGVSAGSTAGTSFDMSAYAAGEYSVKIVATKEGCENSSCTAQIVKRKLLTPQNIEVAAQSGTLAYVITWEQSACADSYILTVGDEQITVEDTTFILSKSDIYWGQSQILTFSLQAADSNADYLVSAASEELTLGKLYSVSVDGGSAETGSASFSGDVYALFGCTVTFDSCGGSEVASQTVTPDSGLVYPSAPVRAGYVFRGWYTDSSCAALYDFTADVTGDITLYAGWQQAAGSSYTIISAVQYCESSSPYCFSTEGTSSTSPSYICFTAYVGGTYAVYYKNGQSSNIYGACISMCNATSGEIIKNNELTTSTSYLCVTFDAEAGDVFYMAYYRYYSEYSTDVYLYVTGAAVPQDGGTANGIVRRSSGGFTQGYAAYGSTVTFTAQTADERYVFLGWYSGDKLLSQQAVFEYVMEGEVSLTAVWTYYSLTTVISDEAAGTATGYSGTPVKAGESVTLTACTNDGYTWLGWYCGQNFVTASLTYTFTMPCESVVYTAMWAECPVELAQNYAQAGTVSGLGGATVVGERVTVTAQTNDGYTWVGWYCGDTLLTESLSYTFAMPSQSTVYTAVWAYYTLTVEYTQGGTVTGILATVTFDSCGGSEVASQTVTYNSALAYPEIPVYDGYIFRGWYADSACTQLYDFTADIACDITLYAGWQKMTSSGYLSEIITAAEHGGASAAYSFSTEGTSSASCRYTYFTAYTGGEYTIYYKNSSEGDSYRAYVYIYNDTQNKEILVNTAAPAGYASVTFTAEAGDVIYIKSYCYSNATTLSFYVTGAGTPQDGGTFAVQIKSDGDRVTAGESVTLAAYTAEGYTWLGWYCGDALITTEQTFTFTMPEEDLVYTAMWRQQGS